MTTADEANAADLVATVAHELRSPLTTIKGFTATLLARWDRFSDDQKKVMLQAINADADRVTRLIADLLDVSRIDSGRLELRLQVVDVAEAVRKTVAGRVAAGEDPDRFEVDVALDLPEIWADPDKLDQILANLVENAVHHGAGAVRIAVMRDLDGIAGTLSDDGPGIREDMHEHVFAKFGRVPGSGHSGSGLGLYVVKGLVEAHGGSIAVGRAESGGAEFRFRLPAGAPPYAQ